MIIPNEWLQPVKMDRVIAHWTAGTHKASVTDKHHYHFIIEGDGKMVKGDHPVKANVSTSDADGYAAHTSGCNTRSIGISMACMNGAIEAPFNPGKYPMTEIQWTRMVYAIADLCTYYKIPVTEKTVLSHAEVQGTLGIKQKGKWDFTRLAFDPSVVGAKAIGDKMRREVSEAMKGKPKPVAPVKKEPGQVEPEKLVVITTPKAEPVVVIPPEKISVKPEAPVIPVKKKTGIMAIGGIIAAIIAGLAKYFGG